MANHNRKVVYPMARMKNVFRGLAQAYGPQKLKETLWDAEFSRGSWDCLESTPDDCVYPYLEKYAARGRILDMGCGSGNTANEIGLESYRDYTGVDISRVAVEKAIRRSQETGRSDKNRFVQADFFLCRPDGVYDVILFRDSIYYVPFAKIGMLLERYSGYLTPHGVFIVRMWGGSDKNTRILNIVENNFTIVEKRFHNSPSAVIVVFR